jgi:transcriptional regulator with XRE-family HTH domain
VGLREFRRERNLTLEAVSVLSEGLNPSTNNRIERGLVDPRPETVVKLARGLGVSARRMKAILDESQVEA